MTGCSAIVRHRVSGVRCGGILLEILVSLAVFFLVGLAAVNLTSAAVDSCRRSGELRRAVDIARSTVSRIELGEVGPEAASGPVARRAIANAADGDAERTLSGWWVQVETKPGPISELTLVVVQVLHDSAAGTDGSAGVKVYELAQLVGLGNAAP